MSIELGFEGTLTINAVNPGFTNLRLGFSHTEVDTTTNLDVGKKSYIKGLQDQYIGADMVLDDSAACTAVMAAVNGRTAVPVTATLDKLTITSNMYVFGGEVSVGLDDVPKMPITCRPAPKAEQGS